MPCIQVRTNIRTSRQVVEEVKEALEQAISCLPRKSEDWPIVSIEDGYQTFFGGKGSRPTAMVEVKILGGVVDQEDAKYMTGEMTRVLGGTSGVPPDNIYIKYEASPNWGWNGTNF